MKNPDHTPNPGSSGAPEPLEGALRDAVRAIQASTPPAGFGKGILAEAASWKHPVAPKTYSLPSSRNPLISLIAASIAASIFFLWFTGNRGEPKREIGLGKRLEVETQSLAKASQENKPASGNLSELDRTASAEHFESNALTDLQNTKELNQEFKEQQHRALSFQRSVPEKKALSDSENKATKKLASAPSQPEAEQTEAFTDEFQKKLAEELVAPSNRAEDRKQKNAEPAAAATRNEKAQFDDKFGGKPGESASQKDSTKNNAAEENEEGRSRSQRRGSGAPPGAAKSDEDLAAIADHEEAADKLTTRKQPKGKPGDQQRAGEGKSGTLGMATDSPTESAPQDARQNSPGSAPGPGGAPRGGSGRPSGFGGGGEVTRRSRTEPAEKEMRETAPESKSEAARAKDLLRGDGKAENGSEKDESQERQMRDTEDGASSSQKKKESGDAEKQPGASRPMSRSTLEEPATKLEAKSKADAAESTNRPAAPSAAGSAAKATPAKQTPAGDFSNSETPQMRAASTTTGSPDAAPKEPSPPSDAPSAPGGRGGLGAPAGFGGAPTDRSPSEMSSAVEARLQPRFGMELETGKRESAAPAVRYVAIADDTTLLFTTGGTTPLELGQVVPFSQGNLLHRFDWSKPEKSRILTEIGPTALTTSPTGDSLLNANGVLFEITGKKVERLANLGDNIRSLAISPTGKEVITQHVSPDVAHNVYFRISDLPSGKERFVLPNQWTDDFTPGFSTQGDFFALLGKDRVVREFAIADGAETKSFSPALPGGGGAIEYAPNGKLLACLADSGDAYLYDRETAQLARELKAPPAPPGASAEPLTALRFSPDSNFLAASTASNLFFWNVASGEVAGQLPPGSGGAIYLRYTEEGKKITSIKGFTRVATEDGTPALKYPTVETFEVPPAARTP